MKKNRIDLWKVVLLSFFALTPVAAHAFDFSWNGFGSAYYAQALSADALPYQFTSTHVDFTHFSLMGLNLRANINDDLSFASQLVALGSPVGTSDNFELIAQWATATYTPMEGTSFTVGRQLFPYFLASEYFRVGFLLPYQHLPACVFFLAPFTRFDGASAHQELDTAVGKLAISVFGGTPVIDVNSNELTQANDTLTVTEADLLGAQIALDGSGWRIRAMAARNYFTINTQVVSPSVDIFQNGHQQQYSAGYRYDKHNIVSWGEYVLVRTPDGTPTNGGRVTGDGHGFYVLGGYRIGRFMPRYTFAQGSQTFNIPSAAVSGNYANGRLTTHTLGVNYSAGSQAVIKVEYEHNVFPSPQGGGYMVQQTATSTSTSGDAFYAGLDFIF